MADDEIADKKGRGPIWLTIAGAVGGATLTLGVQFIGDISKENREIARAATAAAAARLERQDRRLADLYQEYLRLNGKRAGTVT